MKLYGITADDVVTTISSPAAMEEQGGSRAVMKEFAGKYSGYPLKVVYEQKGGDVVVITAYPLKKKAWR